MTALAQKQKSQTNPLKSLHEQGQAVWLDFLSRGFIAEGGLDKLIEHDGLSGITSNPSIFEKAIAEGGDYDGLLKEVEASGDLDIMALYERLAIADIRRAADRLRPVYQATQRADGYVSLEVSPYLAMDTEATVAEALRLAKAVGRDNLMIKVPATEAGLPAIRRLIGEGINVNITLLFSQSVYEDVVEAYFAGLEHFITRGGDPSTLASVASFFVSRIDVAVDRLIDERLARENDAEKKNSLAGLRGRVAVANAKLAYQRYRRLFAGGRWEKLKVRGARVQRLLWASTSTKNPDYSDVLYVEELIGRDTVNTMPPKTMDAFRDHGRVRPSLEEDIDAAEQTMSALARGGISIDAVTAQLTQDGVQLFADAFDKLLGAVARKRVKILGDKLDDQELALPAPLEKAVTASLDDWRRAGNVRRLWAGDASLWTGTDENQWVGWLDIVDDERKHLQQLNNIAADIGRQKFSNAVLLGMGGSSLGAEVLAKTFGHGPNHPTLLVLDSTDPEQILTVEQTIDIARTVFIVSSKSGSTLEPNILKAYFYDKVQAAIGSDQAGSRFIAVTDPGSDLEAMAKRDGFRHIAFGKPSIGGRYSVLSNFGLVPAAVIGLDIGRLLSSTQIMMRACGPEVPPADNPGVVLGTVLGTAAKAGRNKVTIVASPAIADFGAWLEQLLAESTGKQGKGLIPVDAEPLGAPAFYGQDRLFAYIRLAGKADNSQDKAIEALERAGHPLVRISVAEPYQIGQEFFRWEIATAVAGAIIAIDPFNQPDVEASKVKARELTDAYEKSGKLPQESPLFEENGIAVFADAANAKALSQSGDGKALVGLLRAHLARLGNGDYCALLAYIARDRAHWDALQDMRGAIRDAKHVATCVGFGPRFLHSTGQAYKGGPNAGVFLELSSDSPHDLPIPGHTYSFGAVIAAQARGDFSVLNERKRRAVRLHLGSDVAAGMKNLQYALRQALQ